MPLTINTRHLEEEALSIKGKLPAPELELDHADDLARARLPLYFDLTARLTGRDVLISGRLEMVLDCECARCLKPFQHRIEMPEWTAHLPLEGPDKAAIKDDLADLTPSLREDILLEYPQHPLCAAGCAGLPNRDAKDKTKGASPTESSSAWSELNKLKF
jgi:uncharacterized metal-binding protein YceD (DUF177 family)